PADAQRGRRPQHRIRLRPPGLEWQRGDARRRAICQGGVLGGAGSGPMRKVLVAVAGCCLLLASSIARADMPGDPLSWLGRIASAAERVNFTGTFMYQSGAHS